MTPQLISFILSLKCDWERERDRAKLHRHSRTAVHVSYLEDKIEAAEAILAEIRQVAGHV